jgi:uncharacterized membrane protein YeaQ/YmgE (transglycosylase-associated protein family)
VGWHHRDQPVGSDGDIVVGIVETFVGLAPEPLFHVSTINEGNFSIPALLVSLGGAVILLIISKFVRCIGWVFVILLVVVAIYTYYTCWSLASTSLFCTTVHALPFLR